jgi:molybdopterin-guanine dinucleotide biosynthesis protein A
MVVTLAALPAEAEAGWPLRRLVERAGLAALAVRREVRLGCGGPIRRRSGLART